MTDLLLIIVIAIGFGLGRLYTSVKADRARHLDQIADQNTWASTATRWQEHARKAEARLSRVEALCLQRCEIELGECRCWFCRVRSAARGGVDQDVNAESRT